MNRGCHNPPCGTGPLDGGHERAENFHKIVKALESAFVDVRASVKSDIYPDEAAFWYPDYNTAWSEAGCSNKLPLPFHNPKDRPRYDTQLECCQNSYGNQVSGKCLSQLPSPPSQSPIDASGDAQDPGPSEDGAVPDPSHLSGGMEPPHQDCADIGTGTDAMEKALLATRRAFDDELFLHETPAMQWVPSKVYRFDGFFAGLQIMHSQGIADKKLYTGGDDPECKHCHMYGLVNLAAFLAQAMKETIRYDACDENSWDRVGRDKMYPISNSCGQLGQSYQDYRCSDEEKHMECEVDPEMTITAVTNARWWGAPGPLICGPKSLYPQTGYWNFNGVCDDVWADPPKFCTAYEGQKGGAAVNDEPYANAAGRTDVEGCCWWGRGVIQTTGICNFGKLNYFL